MTDTSYHPAGLRHEAFLYADAEEFLAGAVEFVRAGLESEEAILVAMPRPRLELLSDALGGAGERLHLADMSELGRNPSRIIPAWRDFIDESSAGGRGLRGLGEPAWAGRSGPELDECRRHESLVNLAFAGTPGLSLMCAYDTAGLDEEAIAAARRTHPLISRPTGSSASESYVDAAPSPFEGELEPAPSDATALGFGVRELSEVRQFAAERAQALGLDFARIDDFVLATDELATNSLQHGTGSGGGTLRIWRLGSAIVCQVDNEGRIEDALAGRRRPGPDQARGRGLWLVNQLCDLLQIRCEDSGSVVARLQMTLHRKLPS